MKKLLIIPIFLFSLICSATTYYVSTTGSNSSAGTITQPFLTIQYGVDHLSSPGDILYIRGGIYYSTSSTIVSIGSGNGSGTSGNTKKVYAYSGETVIINGANQNAAATHYGIYVQNVNYWEFKGLNITNILEETASYYGEGFDLGNANNILIENCSVYHCASGFFLAWSTNVTYKNCDAYDNANKGDGDPGGYSNGFTAHTHGTSVVIYDGCRAWLNSDDGFDMYGSSGYITINNCWAFRNGYGNNYNGNINGNGAGIKTGANDTNTESGVQRIVTNCLSFNNLSVGFDKSNDSGPEMINEVYNNVFYHNGDGAFNFTHATVKDIFRNNVAFDNTQYPPIGNGSAVIDHNNFTRTSENGNLTVSNADFLSVDATGTDGSRQADGSLPVLNFLKLANGSKLINAGADVSLPYSGSAPDLGAYETSLSTAPAVPAYVSSAVDNATPSVIGMTYTLSLAPTVPASSAFSVKVNSVARTVNTVTISGAKVQLTLASPVVNGDVITVTYTQPATNLLQGTSGDKAVTLSAQIVTNNTVSTINDVTSGIKMTINPNRIHHFINIQFVYSGSFSAQNAAFSPQIIRIFDISGKLVTEKLLVTGVASAVIPINIRSGIYTVLMFSGGLQMSTQKIVVY